MFPSIISGVPSTDSLRFLVPYGPGPAPPVLTMRRADGLPSQSPLQAWPLPDATSPIWLRVRATALTPGTAYTLEAAYPGGSSLSSGPQSTFPAAMERPFTIAFGSCYSAYGDPGGMSLDQFPPPPFRTLDNPISLRFLMGDQIYLDLSPTSIWPRDRAPDVWRDYRAQWESEGVARFLAAAPSAYLADDHEYWNDYPHRPFWLPWTGPGVEAEARAAFHVYQAALNPAPNEPGGLIGRNDRYGTTFTIDAPPLSFFVLDTRTLRQPVGPGASFLTVPPPAAEAEEIRALRNWVGRLTGPGVLVLGPTLISRPSGGVPGLFHKVTHRSAGDSGLPDYPRDYQTLWSILRQSRHCVIVLSGDIHENRVAWHPRDLVDRTTPPIYEFTASPLNLIPEMLRLGPERREPSEPAPFLYDVSGSLKLGDNIPIAMMYGPEFKRGIATLTVESRNSRYHFDLRYWNHSAVGPTFWAPQLPIPSVTWEGGI